MPVGSISSVNPYNHDCDDYDPTFGELLMSSSLERILERLRGVRHSGGGWIARCPAHADRSPSLSVREQNGRILLHCFAGCPVEAVCTALGIETKDLFAEPRLASRREPVIVCQIKKKIASLRSRLTPRDRERDVTVVLATQENPSAAFARALALAVEGNSTNSDLLHSRDDQTLQRGRLFRG